MLTDRFSIAELEQSDIIPERYDMPGNAHLLDGTIGDACAAALAVQTKQEADVELLIVTAIHLHQAGGTISWREGFVRAREAIAWYAFACDVSEGGYIGETDPETNHESLLRRREITASRDIAFEMYGARLNLREGKTSREPEQRMEHIARRIAKKRPRVTPGQMPTLF